MLRAFKQKQLRCACSKPKCMRLSQSNSNTLVLFTLDPVLLSGGY